MHMKGYFLSAGGLSYCQPEHSNWILIERDRSTRNVLCFIQKELEEEIIIMNKRVFTKRIAVLTATAVLAFGALTGWCTV